MSGFKIPIDATAGKFKFKILINEVNYVFKFRYNHRLNQWIWAICDESGAEIIANIPMLSDIALTQTYTAYPIPASFFFCYDTTSKNRNPDRYDFGTEVIFIRDDLQ
jgi:hypothetical protein